MGQYNLKKTYESIPSTVKVGIAALLVGGVLGMGLHGFVTSRFGPVCQVEYTRNGESINQTIAQKNLDEMFTSQNNGNISDLVVTYCGKK